jgi:hypothetical protein
MYANKELIKGSMNIQMRISEYGGHTFASLPYEEYKNDQAN